MISGSHLKKAIDAYEHLNGDPSNAGFKQLIELYEDVIPFSRGLSTRELNILNNIRTQAEKDSPLYNVLSKFQIPENLAEGPAFEISLDVNRNHNLQDERKARKDEKLKHCLEVLDLFSQHSTSNNRLKQRIDDLIKRKQRAESFSGNPGLLLGNKKIVIVSQSELYELFCYASEFISLIEINPSLLHTIKVLKPEGMLSQEIFHSILHSALELGGIDIGETLRNIKSHHPTLMIPSIIGLIVKSKHPDKLLPLIVTLEEQYLLNQDTLNLVNRYLHPWIEHLMYLQLEEFLLGAHEEGILSEQVFDWLKRFDYSLNFLEHLLKLHRAGIKDFHPYVDALVDRWKQGVTNQIEYNELCAAFVRLHKAGILTKDTIKFVSKWFDPDRLVRALLILSNARDQDDPQDKRNDEGDLSAITAENLNAMYECGEDNITFGARVLCELHKAGCLNTFVRFKLVTEIENYTNQEVIDFIGHAKKQYHLSQIGLIASTLGQMLSDAYREANPVVLNKDMLLLITLYAAADRNYASLAEATEKARKVLNMPLPEKKLTVSGDGFFANDDSSVSRALAPSCLPGLSPKS